MSLSKLLSTAAKQDAAAARQVINHLVRYQLDEARRAITLIGNRRTREELALLVAENM